MLATSRTVASRCFGGSRPSNASRICRRTNSTTRTASTPTPGNRTTSTTPSSSQRTPLRRLHVQSIVQRGAIVQTAQTLIDVAVRTRMGAELTVTSDEDDDGT